jgi:peptide/nickel transport system substrate-binding protein
MAWLDLAADVPPAVLHREFFHSTGAFRAGPPIAEFQELIGRFAVATDPGTLGELTTDIDRFVYHQALSVFLCAPQALYAVNRHVAFDGYAATSSWPRPRSPSSTGHDGRHFAPRDGVAWWMRCCFRRSLRPSSVEAKTWRRWQRT